MAPAKVLKKRVGVRGKPFVKGKDSRRAPGRPAGSKNKVPVAVKEFFRAMVEDPEVQEAFKGQILGGDRGSMAAFLGAAHMVVGKPKETVEVSTTPSMSKLLLLALAAANEKARAGKTEKS